MQVPPLVAAAKLAQHGPNLRRADQVLVQQLPRGQAAVWLQRVAVSIHVPDDRGGRLLLVQLLLERGVEAGHGGRRERVLDDQVAVPLEELALRGVHFGLQLAEFFS